MESSMSGISSSVISRVAGTTLNHNPSLSLIAQLKASKAKPIEYPLGGPGANLRPGFPPLTFDRPAEVAMVKGKKVEIFYAPLHKQILDKNPNGSAALKLTTKLATKLAAELGGGACVVMDANSNLYICKRTKPYGENKGSVAVFQQVIYSNSQPRAINAGDLGSGYTAPTSGARSKGPVSPPKAPQEVVTDFSYGTGYSLRKSTASFGLLQKTHSYKFDAEDGVHLKGKPNVQIWGADGYHIENAIRQTEGAIKLAAAEAAKYPGAVVVFDANKPPHIYVARLNEAEKMVSVLGQFKYNAAQQFGFVAPKDTRNFDLPVNGLR
jgi:hypothetical protein